MILVTGGTGMLGAHLLLELVSKGEHVRAIKRETSNIESVKKVFSFYNSNIDELFSKIEWFETDMLDIEGLSRIMDGVDKVYHAAAQVSFDPRKKYQMINNNVKSTANIINISLQKGIKKLCHVSSVSALGNSDKNSLKDEETYRNPKDSYSGYSISKFRSELEVWRGIIEGLNAVIVNPSIILGPGDWKSGSSSIFYNVANGLKYYTKGITGYVDVWDVVNSMIKLMESEINNQRYVISAENLSFKELFSMIANELDVKEPSLYANSFMLEIGWRFETIRSKITGKMPLITKDMARSAKNFTFYSNKKFTDTFDYKFTPISESISRIAKIYKNDMMSL